MRSSSFIVFNFLLSATPGDRKTALPIIEDLENMVTTVLHYKLSDLPSCNSSTNRDSDSFSLFLSYFTTTVYSRTL